MGTITTKGKRFQTLRRQLRAANARFKKMTKAQQRVEIAKDVIAQLKAEKLVASSTYLTVLSPQWDNVESAVRDNYGSVPALADHPMVELDASEALSQVQCEVCGIGSLFVCAVRKADQVKVKELMADNTRSFEVNYLSKWFTPGMLDEIEEYYERHGGADFNSPIKREYDNNKRLLMIMENIISNRGKFDPYKGAHRIISIEEEAAANT